MRLVINGSAPFFITLMFETKRNYKRESRVPQIDLPFASFNVNFEQETKIAKATYVIYIRPELRVSDSWKNQLPNKT